MSPKPVPGDRVIIQIRSSEVFEGTIESVSSVSIELYNIHCQSTSSPYEGNMTFYRNEVVSISRIGDSPKSEASPSVNGTFMESKKINMHRDEFDRLKSMTYNFQFIDTFGKKFEDAVEVLRNRESVAVVGLGSTSTRGKLSLLLMADFKQVFIFDLFCLVELKGLKEVLESEFICKVVHDGAALFDCFYHKYEVEMRNVFDTQIVDTKISQDDDNKNVKRNISECLTFYFNFPPSLLSATMDDIADRTWLDRPIIKSVKIRASQLVTYLLSLRDLLMAKILHKYTNAIQTEYDKYKHMTDLQLLTKNMTLNSK